MVSEIAFKSSDYLTALDKDALQNDLDKAGYLETNFQIKKALGLLTPK